MGNLKFNNKSIEDLGLVVLAPPKYNIPERDYDVKHIKGRRGDLLFDRGSFSNVEVNYTIAGKIEDQEEFIQKSRILTSLLYSQSGYIKIEDTYDKETYRMGTILDSAYLENEYDQAVAMDVTFNCKPQRFFKTGDIEVNYTDLNVQHILVNNTSYESNPLIVLRTPNPQQATHNFGFSINGSPISVGFTYTSLHSDMVVIDCETGIIYTERNGDLVVDPNTSFTSFVMEKFPTLLPGRNSIKVTSKSVSDDSVGIIPRWWTL